MMRRRKVESGFRVRLKLPGKPLYRRFPIGCEGNAGLETCDTAGSEACATRRLAGSFNHTGGFTMVEIAFSLAIVAFALVAIMGVLPTGMTVQRDNREDTIINNDGAFWAEALRSGSRGIDDLTNYVEEITIATQRKTERWTNSWDSRTEIISGEQIVRLLSTPKYTNISGQLRTNIVTARVRAINGPAIDKRSPTNEFAFRYELQSEVTPMQPAPIDTENADASQFYRFFTVDGASAIPYHLNVSTNLHNLRLTMRWPMFEQGATWGVGRNRRTVRTLINGQMSATARERIQEPGSENHYIAHPNTYQYVTTQKLP